MPPAFTPIESDASAVGAALSAAGGVVVAGFASVDLSLAECSLTSYTLHRARRSAPIHTPWNGSSFLLSRRAHAHNAWLAWQAVRPAEAALCGIARCDTYKIAPKPRPQ